MSEKIIALPLITPRSRLEVGNRIEAGPPQSLTAFGNCPSINRISPEFPVPSQQSYQNVQIKSKAEATDFCV